MPKVSVVFEWLRNVRPMLSPSSASSAVTAAIVEAQTADDLDNGFLNCLLQLAGRLALNKVGVDSVLIPVQGGHGNFSTNEVVERMRQFFDKHLRGKDVPRSSRAGGEDHPDSVVQCQDQFLDLGVAES